MTKHLMLALALLAGSVASATAIPDDMVSDYDTGGATCDDAVPDVDLVLTGAASVDVEDVGDLALEHPALADMARVLLVADVDAVSGADQRHVPIDAPNVETMGEQASIRLEPMAYIESPVVARGNGPLPRRALE